MLNPRGLPWVRQASSFFPSPASPAQAFQLRQAKYLQTHKVDWGKNETRMYRVAAKVGLFGLCVALTLGLLEMTARWIGLGDPVLYYTAAWGGLRPLPDQQVERLGGATVTVDENGFRTARDHLVGALRILFIGDSVTWGGSRIDDSALFSEVSADVLRAQGITVYAMNAGVNGTSLVNHAEVFRGNMESTDILVWLFPPGDVERAYNAGGDVYPARFRPRFALVEAVDLTIFIHWRLMFRHDVPEKIDWHNHPESYNAFFAHEKLARRHKNIQALSCVLRTSTEMGIPVLVGLTPYVLQGDMVAPPRDLIRSIEASAGPNIHLFDTHELFRRPDLSELLLDSVHFSVRGHQVLGEAVGDRLLSVVAQLKREPSLKNLEIRNPTCF